MTDTPLVSNNFHDFARQLEVCAEFGELADFNLPLTSVRARTAANTYKKRGNKLRRCGDLVRAARFYAAALFLELSGESVRISSVLELVELIDACASEALGKSIRPITRPLTRAEIDRHRKW